MKTNLIKSTKILINITWRIQGKMLVLTITMTCRKKVMLYLDVDVLTLRFPPISDDINIQ